jgi:hypothetical protein
LDKWIETEKNKGYDPYDALNSPLLKFLTFGNKKISQGWVQINKLCPINFRPFLGIPKALNPKGIGVFLSTYSKRYIAIQNAADLEQADFFAKWLLENASDGYHGFCWGYNFDWPNRNFYAPAGTPTIVNTSFIGLAFLDYAQALKKAKRPSDSALQIATSASNFILNDLNVSKGDNELCFSYTPIDHCCVHNANMLGAWLLSAAHNHNHDPVFSENALKATRFTARHIESNGTWKYGIDPKNNWVDNFHTGYILVALKQISKNLGINEFEEQISLGYKFWKKNFFLPDGTPKYYPDSIYPVDSHSIAHAILTFLEFSDVDPEAMSWAERVAKWGCNNMQDPSGYFYYQKNRYYTNKIPYMRWSQAWMQHALAEMVRGIGNENLA